MECQTCHSERLIGISAKCDDRFIADAGDAGQYEGYVPRDLGIGGGDYIAFTYCSLCGQIQGTWPLSGPGEEAE